MKLGSILAVFILSTLSLILAFRNNSGINVLKSNKIDAADEFRVAVVRDIKNFEGKSVRNSDIISIIQHPEEQDIYILQLSGSSWGDNVYLVDFKDGKIVSIELINDGDCVTIADFIYLNDYYYINYYFSSHKGNGGYKLYSVIDKKTLDVQGVYDCNFEGKDYSSEAIVHDFPNYPHYSFVFKNNYLAVSKIDCNNDSYEDLVFSGTQELYGDEKLLYSENCQVVFLYDPLENDFELSLHDSVFPIYWFANWNAIGK